MASFAILLRYETIIDTNRVQPHGDVADGRCAALL